MAALARLGRMVRRLLRPPTPPVTKNPPVSTPVSTHESRVLRTPPLPTGARTGEEAYWAGGWAAGRR